MHHNAEYCKWCKSALAEVQEQDNIKEVEASFHETFYLPLVPHSGDCLCFQSRCGYLGGDMSNLLAMTD